MALSPTIPTSFVPKQPMQQAPRHTSTGNNIFLVVAFVLLLVAVVLAGGTFFYAQYLTSVQSAKAAELLAAQGKVSENDVSAFVRLHDRFVAAEAVLDQHVALSQFFTLLGSITLKNVTFTSLEIQVATDRSAQVTMTGNAADFNTLAAESNIFAQQTDITNAIFSGITVNKDGTVGFTLAADVKPDLIIEKGPPSTPALLPAPIATSTASTTSPVLAPTVVVPAITTAATGTPTAAVSSTTP